MPYYINSGNPDCSGWAVEKEDGTVLGCHTSKEDAIAQMVAVSIAEGIEPAGEASREKREDEELLVVDIDGTLLANGVQPMEDVIDAVNASEYPVVLLTGRMETNRDETVEQLTAAGVNYVRLIMNEGSEEPEAVATYKQDVVRMLLDEGYDIDAFVDNSEMNREAIQSLGVDVYSPDEFVAEQMSEMEGEPEEQPMEYESRAASLVAPDYMQESARRGLELHEQGYSGDGLKPQTVEDARKMADGVALSEAKWRKIGPWIARHIGDLDAVEGDEITPGLVAMLLWGGGSSKESARRAQDYAVRLVNSMDEERAPAPKKDQIFGSDENPEGSAQDKTGGIEISEETETALKNKVEEHNADMKERGRPEWTQTNMGAVKAVYRRGAGAFSTSHRPGMTRNQWAMARVNAFLYLCRVGSPENKNYITDNDLLDKNHPKYSGDSQNSRRSTTMGDTMTTAQPIAWVPVSKDERRSVAYSNLEVRAMGDSTKLIGYAAVFDSPSEPLPWIEFVRRGAFTKTLKDGADVRLLIDHEGIPLARSKSGTLTMEEDERGLRVEADLDPMNPDAQRVLSAMRRGDMTQMSFAFRTIKDAWNKDRSVRELKEVQLYDVSIVTFPAYEETIAELRKKTDTAIIDTANSLLIRKNQLAIARHKQSDGSR